MKRVLLFFMTLILLIVGCSYAESFSIRNGITFGMDVDEVEKIEAQNGLMDGVNNRDENPNWSIASLKYFDKKLLGFDGIMLQYLYDKSTNEVFSIQYSGYYKGKREDVFNSLSKLLVDKYGPSGYNTTNKELPPFLTDGFKEELESYQFYAEDGRGTKANSFHWSSWLVEYDDYYVDISLFSHYRKDTFGIERTTFELQYTMRSVDEVSERFQQGDNNKQGIMDSI